MNALATAGAHAGPNRDGWIVIVLVVVVLGTALVLAIRNLRRKR